MDMVIDAKGARLQRMKRSVLTTARLTQEHLEHDRRRYKVAFLTLTYREGAEWEPKHVSELLKAMREWARRQGATIPYVWVAELTKRGRLHYHVLLYLPRGLSIPKPDKRGWWKHGSTSIEWARRPVGYVAKYASKGESRPFPKGCRLSGFGGAASLVKRLRRWWLLPSWLRQAVTPEHEMRRAVGGGFVSLALGELVQSPWLMLRADSASVVIRMVGDPPGPLMAPVGDRSAWPLSWRDLGRSLAGDGLASIVSAAA